MRWVRLNDTNGRKIVVNAEQIAYMQRWVPGGEAKPYTAIMFAAAKADVALLVHVTEEPEQIIRLSN